MSDQVSRVRLPILIRFAVSDYQLYPGPDGNGVEADVLPGVNLVIGINGLGKTTLLNALFRIMSGPVDWSSRPFDKQAGSTSTALGKWKTKEFFTRRVPDRAKDATVSATLGFGRDQIAITRRLSDLAITSLQVNGQVRPRHEDTYRSVICELAGLPDFSDFYLVLRYLVFFLEDRQAVIWDKTAQSDILRVLFYDADASETVRDLFERIQKLDSEYRNKRVPFRVAEEELRQAKSAQAIQPEVRNRLKSVLTELAGHEAREEDLGADIVRLEGEYIARLRLLEQKRREMEEQVREYERLEQRYLGVIFPDLDEVVEYVFAHVGSGGGCLVCGNRTADIPGRLRDLRTHGQCPVCDSPPERQERITAVDGVVPVKEVADRLLENAYAVVREYRETIASLVDELEEAEGLRRERETQLLDLRATINTKRRERNDLQKLLPADEQRIAGLEDFVERRGAELAKLKRQRETLDEQFGSIQRVEEIRVRALVDRIRRQFEHFAQHFLADACTLEYTRDERKIGQESAKQRFPLFTVKLASGVFHHTTQPRVQPHEVSESQKEFIDLAFRMALITVASEDQPAMIVLETPEASLDAVFILRAGYLLAQFAAGGGEIGNRLIASSNLNRTEMIPALFGYFRPEDRSALPPEEVPLIPEQERKRRVVDLLELAEQNTALLEHGKSYRRKREEAIYPERYPRAATGSA